MVCEWGIGWKQWLGALIDSLEARHLNRPSPTVLAAGPVPGKLPMEQGKTVVPSPAVGGTWCPRSTVRRGTAWWRALGLRASGRCGSGRCGSRLDFSIILLLRRVGRLVKGRRSPLPLRLRLASLPLARCLPLRGAAVRPMLEARELNGFAHLAVHDDLGAGLAEVAAHRGV